MNITCDNKFTDCREDMLLADWVEQSLTREIADMVERKDLRLPQQNELAETYNVSLRTIRTVVDRLKTRKLIRSVKGKGMFIEDNPAKSGSVLLVANNFSHPYAAMATAVAGDNLLRRGFSPIMVKGEDLEKYTAEAKGMLIIQSSLEIEKFLENCEIPYCGINDALSGGLCQPVWHQTVRNNSYLAGYIATRVLLCAGKDLIFFFGFPGQGQLTGYYDAHKEFKRQCDSQAVIYVEQAENLGFIEFCEKTRSHIKDVINSGRKVGFVDCSGSLSNTSSLAYHQIMHGLFQPEDTVSATFSEFPDSYMAGIIIKSSLAPVISRAIDIIIGQAKPYAICETQDNLTINLNESGIWHKFSQKEYFKLNSSVRCDV